MDATLPWQVSPEYGGYKQRGNGYEPIALTNAAVSRLVQSLFSFNFSRGGRGETSAPRFDPSGYPYDLDGAERFVRPALGAGYWPDVATYPNGNGIGMVSAILPQQDAYVYAQLFARLPAGPSINPLLNNVQNPMEYILQATFPTLQQTGSEMQSGGLT